MNFLTILARIGEFLKNIFTWAFANKQIAIYIVLGLIIAWLTWSKGKLVNDIDQLNIKNASLAADLKLKVNGNTVIYRDKDKIVKVYVPTEGGLIVKEPDKNGNSVIVIKDKGFCLKPGFGAYYDGKFDGALDLKLAFWSRYSGGLGSTLDSPYLWLSRHVDDLVPVLHPQNIEFSLGYGKPYTNFSNSVFLIGLRTNF